ncbi:MAG: YigZ family protein [Bacteroidales bacterium]|nr:YigZ family protein [Bacteroidales bacterium]
MAQDKTRDGAPESRSTDSYKSIASLSEGLFKDNGSRFIALAYPVETEEQVREIVSSLKKEYHDARHHCHAFRLGLDGSTFRASDDGEPSGSAGRPILGQIDSAGLSDILVVVVRYFGGIKLGIPGLIRAYRESTADALSRAEIVTKIARRHFRVHFGYLSMNSVMKLLKELELEARDQVFEMECSLMASVRLGSVETFLERAAKIEGCRVEEIF